MIRYYAKKDGILEELTGANSSCWININKPFNYEELEELSKRYSIPVDFLTDSLDMMKEIQKKQTKINKEAT